MGRSAGGAVDFPPLLWYRTGMGGVARLAKAGLWFLLLATHAASGAESVRWEEIRGWRPFGTRWAGGLDSEGRLVALYDLSFPDFRGRIRLGRIGVRRKDLEKARTALLEAWSESESSDAPVARRQAEEALGKLSADQMPDGLPEGWQRSVPWVSEAAPEGAKGAPPEAFRLSDVDLDRLPHALRLRKALHDAGIALRSFELVRSPEGGGYELFWSPSGDEAEVTPPRKIADLRNRRDGLAEAIAWEVLDLTLKGIVGQIPVPVVSNLLKTAINRYFMYLEMLMRARREMLLEMLDTAEEGAPGPSPLASLSADERRAIAQAIHLSQSSLVSVWRWIWLDAERQWRKDLSKNARRAGDAIRWLESRGERVEPLNARFGQGIEPSGRRRLYALGRFRWLKRVQRPLVAVDYENPSATRERRIGAAGVSVAVDFGLGFVPYVGFLFASAYDGLVEKPMRTSIYWEARLTTHLEERMAGGEEWGYELAVLDGQRANPFEMPRSAFLALIRRRKELIGLVPPRSLLERLSESPALGALARPFLSLAPEL